VLDGHPGYAIVRVDLDVNDDEMRFTVVRVLPSEERADAEVHRLQQVNAEKRCRYFWQYTPVERPDAQAE